MSVKFPTTSIVSIGYDDIETRIDLNTGQGTYLPDPINGSFNLQWWNSSDYLNPREDPFSEIVKCIARVGDTLIVMRSQEGTIASNKNLFGKIYKMEIINSNSDDIINSINIKNETPELGILSYYNRHGKSMHDTTSIDGGATLPSGQLPSHGKSVHDSTTIDGGTVVLPLGQLPSHGTSQHTGTIGSWGQIDKATSNIADIATKSHGSLTDGTISGTTNNHAAIDSHIANTSSAHGGFVGTNRGTSGQYAATKYNATTSIDWNNGNVQSVSLANLGGNTFTFTNGISGGRYMLILLSGGSSQTVTWPGNVKWSGGTAPSLTTNGTSHDIITFAYDGTNYYGGSSLNY